MPNPPSKAFYCECDDPVLKVSTFGGVMCATCLKPPLESISTVSMSNETIQQLNKIKESRKK